MRLSVINEINDLQKKLFGYVGVMSYRYCMVPVKAEPSALLAIEEKVSGQTYLMEDLVTVYPHEKEEEKQIMDLFPRRPEFLQVVERAVVKAFPEFKLSIEKLNRYDETEKDENDANKYVRLTMPEVDKDRKDAILNFVDVQYDICKASMARVEAQCTAKVTALTATDDAAALDEAKKKIKETVDEMNDMRDKLTDDKKKEVEEAYERYLKNGGSPTGGTGQGDGTAKSGVGQSLKLNQ